MSNEEFAFVIMPFEKEFDAVYNDIIKPALEDSCGTKCIRVDETSSPGNIVSAIMEYIHKAKVIIADITSLSPNVTYELGISHVKGNNVIVISQNRDKDNLFHLNGYRTIEYENSIAGGKKLGNTLISLVTNMTWMELPNNPVQDALKVFEKSVSYGQYINLQDEHKRLKKDFDKIVPQIKELEQTKQLIDKLQKENEKLKAQSEFISKIFDKETLEKLRKDLKDEDKVSVVISDTDTGDDNQDGKRITFKPLNKK